MEKSYELLDKLVVHSTGQKIIISVQPPEHKVQMGGTSRYYVFPISGTDDKGPINVRRRFSTFDQLRAVLLSRWPGILIPPLPEKKLKMNVQNAFIHHRKHNLQQFLTQLSKIPFLWYSEQVQLFLKSESAEIDKALAAMTINKIEDLVGKYMNTFPSIEKSYVKQQQYDMINKLKQKVQVHIKKIDSILWQFDNAVTLRRRYKEKTSLLLSKTLVEYERNILLQNMTFMNDSGLEDKLTFGKPNFLAKEEFIQYQVCLASNNDDIQLLNQGIKSQKRQQEALLEALKIRQQYTSKKISIQNLAKQQEVQFVKLSHGNVSMISKIRNSSTQEQLRHTQGEIDHTKLQLNNYIFMCQAINVLLIANGLQIFMQSRKDNYYKLVKRIAEEQLKINRTAKKFWNYLNHMEMGEYVDSQNELQQKYYDKQQKESQQSNSPRKILPENQFPKNDENQKQYEQIKGDDD